MTMYVMRCDDELSDWKAAALPLSYTRDDSEGRVPAAAATKQRRRIGL
jgi:hypothetical protein